jgi:mannose-1-phosphate guanylyltransferase
MPRANYYGLIMAGGRGTRFWPRSRRRAAKQVLKFFGERSLIQQTVDRLRPLIPPERIWIVTSDHLLTEIRRQLPEVPSQQVIAEPAQRNTAPCIGLAARILDSLDPDAVMGVFPADHVITRPSRFLGLLRPAFRAAAQGRIVVLGIQPRWPETGFGYIEFSPGVKASAELQPVSRFREKPGAETAERFVAAGHYFWNAGMFFWRPQTYLDALRKFLPKTAVLLETLPAFGSRRFSAVLRDCYPKCQDISVDYAVMEKAKDVCGIAAADIGWNDVGSWNAVYELLARKAEENISRGDVIVESSTGNYVDASGKLVALVGVKDLVVVDTPDALLIASRDHAQLVSQVVKLLEKQQRNELL